MIGLQGGGNSVKKNKRKRSAKGELMLSGDEESKTESSIIVKQTPVVDDKPLTIFGTVASRVIFQQKKEDTVKVIEQLGGQLSEPKSLDLLLLTFNKDSNLQEALDLIAIEL